MSIFPGRLDPEPKVINIQPALNNPSLSDDDSGNPDNDEENGENKGGIRWHHNQEWTSKEDELTSVGMMELSKVDKVVIQQVRTSLKLCSCFTSSDEEVARNEFEVADQNGHIILEAHEDRGFCTSTRCCWCLEYLLPFMSTFKDRSEQEVVRLSRKVNLMDTCFLVKSQVLEVESPPGTLIGLVRQGWNLYRPTMEVCNGQGDVVHHIAGPERHAILFRRLCTCWGRSLCCCCDCDSETCAEKDMEFAVMDSSGEHRSGTIVKLWHGPDDNQRGISSKDRFGVNFPRDATANVKVTLIAAAFLIDYLYFDYEYDSEEDN